MNEIYFLTNNKHKFLEVKTIADKYGFKIIQYNGEKIEIQSEDLLEIAKTAAFYAYLKLRKPVLVEDAGLFIEALKGFPGPYSSYIFKTIGCTGILELMKNIRNRKAVFRSASVLIYEPYILSSQAEIYGIIAYEVRGDKGFGFDPIFIPEGSNKTFGEMSIEEKNKYSHRARSIEYIFAKLKLLLGENR